jgi:hypothetical protein
LVDDALTGSRLINIAEALRRSVGKERFAAIALHFEFPSGSTMPPFKKRDLARFDTWATEHDLPFGNVQFPTHPLYKIDHGSPVFLETALAWGASDLIAGKRKVNLLFNFIDHYERIVKDLADPSGKYLPKVKDLLWSRDAEGRENLFAPGLVESVFADLFQKLSIDQLFNDIRGEAKVAFPTDYFGIGVPLDDAEMRRHVDWLNRCVSTHASKQLEQQKGESSGSRGERSAPSLARQRRSHTFTQSCLWSLCGALQFDCASAAHYLVRLSFGSRACAGGAKAGLNSSRHPFTPPACLGPECEGAKVSGVSRKSGESARYPCNAGGHCRPTE